MLTLSSSVQAISGVGKATATAFATLKIATVKDLLYHIPFRYDDFSNRATIGEIAADDTVSIEATVQSITQFRSRRGLAIVKATLVDATGALDAVWFNQPYLLTVLRKGTRKMFSGKVVKSALPKRLVLTNPSLEEVRAGGQIHSGRLVPIYPETAEVSSRTIRTMIARVLHKIPKIPETLPADVLARHHLPSLDATLRMLHFPITKDALLQHQRRLAFEEVYLLLLQAKKRKTAVRAMHVPHRLHLTTAQRETFARAFPFAPSPSQIRALDDLSVDLTQTYPTQRLIQGEVGSGKTVVAAFALYCSTVNEVDSVLLAPTQIVARQHFETLSGAFAPLGISVQLVTAETDHQQPAASGTVYVGTHALFGLKTLHPAVVVIDEEHRFGVAQRDTFWQKSRKPHLVTMTATPIPRTIAHTVFADQDVSYLEEIPSKQKRIVTKVIAATARAKAYARIKAKIRAEHTQVFIVCPFIEVSDNDTLATVKAAETEFATLKKVFADFRLALLHGKTPKAERERTFAKLQRGTIDVLVSTPIIEVGIDIPNASIMLIEGAERFGLAQLHQLRGRVGRAGQEAYCVLFTSEGIAATRRLRILETHANGNELAELDLKLRGSGELFGTRQHGWDALRFASWFDEALMRETKDEVGSRPDVPRDQA